MLFFAKKAQNHLILCYERSILYWRIEKKAQQGGEITPEEQAIVNKMTVELNAIAGEEKSKMIDGFLAAQLKLPNSSQDFETRKTFWQRFPFLAKYAIVTEVEERLGLTEIANEKLFPSE